MTRAIFELVIEIVKLVFRITKYPWLVLFALWALAPASPHIHIGDCEYLGRAGLTYPGAHQCSALMLLESPRPHVLLIELKEYLDAKGYA